MFFKDLCILYPCALNKCSLSIGRDIIEAYDTLQVRPVGVTGLSSIVCLLLVIDTSQLSISSAPPPPFSLYWLPSLLLSLPIELYVLLICHCYQWNIQAGRQRTAMLGSATVFTGPSKTAGRLNPYAAAGGLKK